jgi:hypothetical protein
MDRLQSQASMREGLDENNGIQFRCITIELILIICYFIDNATMVLSTHLSCLRALWCLKDAFKHTLSRDTSNTHSRRSFLVGLRAFRGIGGCCGHRGSHNPFPDFFVAL